MALITPRRRAKRRWAAVGVAVALFGLTIGSVANAQLTTYGSTFESSDGNLAADGAGLRDWASVLPSPATTRVDLVKSKVDDAFGQGTKEDDPAVNVVLGSIPPQKSDLSAFHTYAQKENGNQFLYLAWERTNQLGSANMDFELNQHSTDFNVVNGAASPGKYTINRTAGDLLFTFDFGGSGNPTLGMLVWATDASTPSPIGTYTSNTCFSSNAFPCWADRIDLTAAGIADGAVYEGATPITDSTNTSQSSLPANTFGEMGVNLTAALPNIFGPNPTTCESLGSAMLKSRSSSSFPAEVKDFIAPQTISVSNCGYILVHKVAAGTTTGQAGATFTATEEPIAGKTAVTLTDLSGTNDGATPTPNVIPDGYYCVDNLLLTKTFQIDETAAPANYAVDPSTPWTGVTPTAGSCSGLVFGATAPTAQVNAADPVANGAIKVVKTAKNKNITGGTAPLAGASFQVWKETNGTSGLQTTGTTDTLVATQSTALNLAGTEASTCFSGLPVLGSYYVVESAAPTGYAKAATQTATVTAGDCTAGYVTKSFVDVPLSQIQVQFTSLAGAGVTVSSIVCSDGTNPVAATSENGSADPALDDTNETFTNLLPGTYTCSLVVDP